MSKILILSRNTCIEPYPVYPLGGAVIASALVAKGHKVRQFDFLAADRSEDNLREAIIDFAPDFIGISIRNIDNVDSLTPDSSWYLADEKHAINFIRQVTNVPIILGGPGFSILSEEILDYTGADYGVVGEGERAICELIQTLKEGRPAKKILNNNGEYLSGKEMCSPLWEDNLVSYYKDNSGMVNLQTKRGCPYNCIYCTYNSLEGRQVRPREVGAVIDDIDRLKQTFGIDCIFITDSIFNDTEGYYLEFAEALLSSSLDIRWAAYLRPQGIGSKELALLKQAGLYAVEVGTDAGSDRTLAHLKKNFCFDDVLEFNRICLEQQVPNAHFVMFGGPGETEETLKQGLNNLNELKSCVVFAFSGIRILAGTGLHTRAIQDGVLEKDASLFKPVYYFSPDIDPQTMNKTIKEAFKSRRGFFFPPSEAQERAQTLFNFGFRGLLWDQLISF